LSTVATPWMDAVSFGRRLRQLRAARGLTRAQLADASRIKLRTIEAWEQGRGEPLISSVLKLAGALGIEPGELLVDPPDDLPEPPRGRPPKSPPAPERPKPKKRRP
jgi:transcriptional regulator with XRE-family HTH domain